jgi:hypothetical protein
MEEVGLECFYLVHGLPRYGSAALYSSGFIVLWPSPNWRLTAGA